MTDEEARGTSGGAAGTSRLSARALTALLLSAVFLFGLIRIAANVYSYIADREGAGVIVSPTIAWMLEGSSLIAWAVVMIPCWFAVRRIRPPRRCSLTGPCCAWRRGCPARRGAWRAG